MPTKTVFLDEEHNIVSPSEAVLVVHTVTDKKGNLIEERWECVVSVDSKLTDIGELISIYESAYK
jgi:hypothetical protein